LADFLDCHGHCQDCLGPAQGGAAAGEPLNGHSGDLVDWLIPAELNGLDPIEHGLTEKVCCFDFNRLSLLCAAHDSYSNAALVFRQGKTYKKQDLFFPCGISIEYRANAH
jgi:hypothetical protein